MSHLLGGFAYIKDSRPISLRDWAVISKAFEADGFGEAERQLTSTVSGDKHQGEITIPMGLRRFSQEIPDPRCELSVYTNPLGSLDGCLTYLRIENVKHFQAQELLSLAGLSSLAVLEIVEEESKADAIHRMSTRVARGWSEMTNPFAELRVMILSSGSPGLSEGLLNYVLQFPKLEILDVSALSSSSMFRWRNSRNIAKSLGWEASLPRHESHFVSYADALFDRRTKNHRKSRMENLGLLFEDDRQPVALIPRPRGLLNHDYTKGGHHTGLTDRLDQGWQAFLKGNRSFATPGGIEQIRRLRSGPMISYPEPRQWWAHEGPAGSDVFWFLSLLSHMERDALNSSIQARVLGIPVMTRRFVTLRLRGPCLLPAHRLWSDESRIIFSRSKGGQKQKQEAPMDPRPEEEQVQRGLERPGEKEEPNIRLRKRQKLGDVLATFGVPGSGTG
jgi:hypothetical protein